MLCLVSPAEVVPRNHPLRAIKALADEALSSLDDIFEAMYARGGRPSVPPERLLKSMVLMALYSVRSDLQLCEQIQYNLLFRWFLDMDMTEDSWDATTFSKNRERLMEHEVAPAFFGAVIEQARARRLMSAEHFSVDGTLIEAWASLKSFRRRDEEQDDGPRGRKSNRWVDFHGEKRSNDTHESKTDPEARLMRKGVGKEAKLSFSGHALMENRNGLLVDFRIAEANGRAEREQAIEMLQDLGGCRRLTVGADRGYDSRAFIEDCRALNVTPHVAQRRFDGRRRSALDGRTNRHVGYALSQRVRRRCEEIFGWLKTVDGLRRTRFKGKRRTQLYATIASTSFNLLRIANLERRLTT